MRRTTGSGRLGRSSWVGRGAGPDPRSWPAAGARAAAQPQAGPPAGVERARQARAAADPRVVHGAGRARCGRAGCATLLGDDADRGGPSSSGYAETATGLGHCVADGARPSRPTCTPPGAPVAGRARRRAASRRSTATPPPPAAARGPGACWPGRAAGPRRRRVLHRQHGPEHDRGAARRRPREPVRGRRPGRHALAADRDRLARVRRRARRAGRPRARWPAARSASRTASLTRAAARVGWPRDRRPGRRRAARPPREAVRYVDLGWPAGVPDGGRHGFTPAHRRGLETRAARHGRGWPARRCLRRAPAACSSSASRS